MIDIKELALKVAKEFHETYERLAPTFGYETRADTKQFDPISANGKLMVAVCAEILAAYTEGQEPVAYYCGRNQFGSPVFRVGELPVTEGPLYTAPPLPAIPEGMNWQPIETAPKDGEYVAILFRPYANKENALWGACATYSDGDFVDNEGDPMHTPEYWMPLPDAPKP